MKMRTLLNMVHLMDHTGPVYPSGAGGQDIYTLHIHMDGHGDILDSDVQSMLISPSSMFITARGKKERRRK